MNCFMLDKCLKNFGDDSDPEDINVQISCACCGGVVRDANIDQVDGNVKSAESEEEEEAEERDRDRKAIERHILQPKPSRRSCFCCCFSKSRRRIPSEDEGMAVKTTNLHTTSSGSKEIPRS